MGTARLAALAVAAATVLGPGPALAGRVFEWTDKAGTPHYTDNLWEVPAPMRVRYLELIEEEARRKYKPAEIRELKEAGDWPPLQLIRPPALRSKELETDAGRLKLLEDDRAVQRALQGDFRFQWNSYFDERRQLEEAVPARRNDVARAEQALLDARRDDQILGRPQAAWQAPGKEKDLTAARAQLAAAEAAQAALPDKERRLHLGERVYLQPGEDGGPAPAAPATRP
ncbi:MAG: hypothetical protein HY904_26450 [Deltaproteobacteria bacterium]|nr:hypothetical protein [Deltaproteobacteria bacterium]